MDAALQDLYAQVPAIPDCDGRCWTTCGVIDMSDRERQRLRAAGYKITPWKKALAKTEKYWCEALTEDKRCGAYPVRPLLCRLGGAIESLRCVYGCVPEGGWLSDAEGYQLLSEALRISGDPRGMSLAGMDFGKLLASNGPVGAELRRLRDRGQAADLRRARDAVPAAFRRPPGRE
jgi:hypothetical protein